MGLNVKEWGMVEGHSDDERKALRGWYFFDWANQAYALTCMTVVVPALMANLYNQATGGGSEWAGLTVTGDSFYAIILAISMAIVALTAPALGVIADRVPLKKKMLYWYTVIGIIFTALMGLAPFMGSQGYMFLALTFIIATIGFSGGNTIYYAFMPYMAKKEHMDRVSSWGYAYGFIGGSTLLLVHLGVLLASPLDSNVNLAIVFVTSSLWWWGFGAMMFKWTPEPEIPKPAEFKGDTTFAQVLSATKMAYAQVWTTLREIRRFKVLAFFLLAYLLFYDGVNTINGMASAFGESVLRINPVMNIALLLTVNIVAIPMSVAFGALAEKWGTKQSLMTALVIYCLVAVTAIGFAPLEFDGDADHERYDFQYDWDESDNLYHLTTLYDRGVNGWVSTEGEGDSAFRDAFNVFLLDENGEERPTLTLAEATTLVESFDDVSAHRFSFHISGGNLSGSSTVGDAHPTMVDQGGIMDWWPQAMRNLVWEPLGITVSLQWIILGVFVGCVMGAAGAQARSMFSMLIPESRTTEFFGFFGFIGKAAAMVGPILYALSVALFDSRVAILSIVILIIVGTYLTSKVDLEEGIKVAAAEDAKWRESQGAE